MPFFSGFADTFAKGLEQSRQEEADRADKLNALQAGIFQHLATSPDPEIQSHAIAGLLDLAGPRKYVGGWQKMLGKVAESPELPTIRQLVAHGRQIEMPEQVPQANVQSGLPANMPGERLSGTGEPQAAPMPFTPAAQPPPAFAPGASYQPPRTVTVPRKVFDTPEEVAGKTAEAETTGRLRAQIGALRGTAGQSPLSPQEEELLFPHGTLTGAGTVQGKAAPAGSLDATGRPLDPEGYYTTKADPRQPGKIVYYPTIAPPSVTNQTAIASRPLFQHYVGPDGKTPGVWRVSRNGLDAQGQPYAPQFIGYLPQKGQYLQYVDPDTQQLSYIAAPAVYTPGATLTPSAQPPAMAAPPASGVAQPVAGAGGAAAAATAPPQTGARPAAAAPAASGAGGVGTPAAGRVSAPRGIAGGRKRQLEPATGAVIGPDGTPQVARAFLDKGTGTYYSAQDPTQEAQGFIPGDEGAYAVQAYTQANNTLITIHAAMKALEDKGVVNDNNPAHTAALMNSFYSGVTGGNPIDAAVASLTNLAGLQGATQYIRSNSRSYQMFQQALQHLPVAPTQRVAALSQEPIIGRLVTPQHAMIAGSHGWDSFASMYAKLKQAEQIIQEGKGSLAELTGKTAGQAVGGPPAPAAGGGALAPNQGRTATGAPAPTIGQRGVVNGQPAIWDGKGWLPAPAGGG